MSFFAVLTLVTLGLQRTGRLTRIVSREHFHDYGKLMFAFTFFWGYIAFSQYMLYWYANIPEETAWYLLRSRNGWGEVGRATLFCTFALPFAGPGLALGQAQPQGAGLLGRCGSSWRSG